MIEIVINFDSSQKVYRVFEPSTSTVLVSTNITEALVNLNKFLLESGMENSDILSSPDISYHIDSETMKAMIESNVALLRRLNDAPSGFMLSSRKFGGSTSFGSAKETKDEGFRRRSGSFSSGEFKKSYKKFS